MLFSLKDHFGDFCTFKKIISSINLEVFHYNSPTIFCLCLYDIKPFKSQNFNRRIKNKFYNIRLFASAKFGHFFCFSLIFSNIHPQNFPWSWNKQYLNLFFIGSIIAGYSGKLLRVNPVLICKKKKGERSNVTQERKGNSKKWEKEEKRGQSSTLYSYLPFTVWKF